MVEFESAHTGDGVIMKMSGELTVSHVVQAKSVLLEALGRLDYLELDLSLMTEVDISGLQLLCAAHRTAKTQGKRIVVLSASDSIDTAVKDAGLPGSEGCATSLSEGCLWAKGEMR